jgi:copper homeostasis protein
MRGVPVEACVTSVDEAAVNIPIFCMARVAGGGFVPAPGEVELVVRDVEALRAAGAQGIVVGARAR